MLCVFNMIKMCKEVYANDSDDDDRKRTVLRQSLI